MTPLPPDIFDTIQHWPDTVQTRLTEMRTLFHEVARKAEIGPLEESLKWGQPAWRPRKPRTGSTLRMGWTPAQPDRIALFVDCKTDLAARFGAVFPDTCHNDGRRELSFDLATGLHAEALWHLAHATFTYHRAKYAAS